MCAGVPPPFSLRKLPASSSDSSVMVSIPGRKINLDRNSPSAKMIISVGCSDSQNAILISEDKLHVVL